MKIAIYSYNPYVSKNETHACKIKQGRDVSHIIKQVKNNSEMFDFIYLARSRLHGERLYVLYGWAQKTQQRQQ